ncbi:MAG: flavoprotein [Bacteroidetes bacterium MedPE-SWsnd-G2]|nr:MAG: flavoprotein [Bacteroidetes bacterium MedPE-SWsnd-G2]
MIHKNIIVIGGGAAGFFGAINCAQLNPNLSVAILERGSDVLTKVKVSGGGRCNVTHAQFVPNELVLNYPRGEKELLGPFHQFMTGDTIEWFEKRGVPLKIEEDGRMFPESNSSQTIIDCFLNEAKTYKVEVLKNQPLKHLEKHGEFWQIKTKDEQFSCSKILIATGSNPKIWNILKLLGHKVSAPVPSLFTFNIQDSRLKEIPGVVAQDVSVKVLDTNLESNGPLLVTHWGLSAPAILKLSAFGAIELAKRNYKFQIEINFINQNPQDTLLELKNTKQQLAKKKISKSAQFGLPKRLWEQLIVAAGISEDKKWADANNIELQNLVDQLTQAVFRVDGKSTFKEEFVTAGGVELKEVNFKTFESKIHSNLYLAGEVLNIDAITGGFNFQNAWTGAYLAAKAMSQTE